MSDRRVYGMGKSCSWLVVACNTAKVSVGQNFASIFITMKEMAPVYLGQVMNRSWVKYGMAMDGLLEGRVRGQGWFFSSSPSYPCSGEHLSRYLRYVLLIARQYIFSCHLLELQSFSYIRTWCTIVSVTEDFMSLDIYDDMNKNARQSGTMIKNCSQPFLSSQHQPQATSNTTNWWVKTWKMTLIVSWVAQDERKSHRT